MRTHLGTPAQSFEALGRTAASLLQQLQADGSPQAAASAWQQGVLQQLAAAVPAQPVEQQAEQGVGQPQEPQQLLQPLAAAAPGAQAVRSGSG
jgi:hypothetical protein